MSDTMTISGGVRGVFEQKLLWLQEELSRLEAKRNDPAERARWFFLDVAIERQRQDIAALERQLAR